MRRIAIAAVVVIAAGVAGYLGRSPSVVRIEPRPPPPIAATTTTVPTTTATTPATTPEALFQSP
jgi:hypothetical protein